MSSGRDHSATRVTPEKQDVLATLGRIVERATQDNDDGIIRNIIRVIDRNRLWGGHWDVLEHFLAQCAVQFPHSLDYVARVVAWRHRRRESVDVPLWTEIARVAAIQHSALGRDSETCWSLWLLKELSVKVSKDISDSVADNCSSFVLAFLAHFPRHKMASDRKMIEKLRGRVSGDPFSGASWPLALELNYLGAADPAWAASDALPILRGLHGAKVSIIDWDAPPKVFDMPPAHDDDEDDDPDYAIEDFGSDYENEDDEEDENEEAPKYSPSDAELDDSISKLMRYLPSSREDF